MLKKLLSTAFILVLGFSGFSQDLPTLLESYKFRNVGPLRGGRVTAVAGVATKPSLFYMGATGGGVWKTKDFGMSWENISDGYFSTPSIGAISVYQNQPEIIYVGTGSDGLRSNVITGKGMYKSTDEGKTWEFIGLKKAGQIGAVEIHPDNPDIVYVAAIGQAFSKNEERGVFKTTDGGASWEKVFYHSDSVGVSDLELAPDDPNTIYAGAWRGERKPWTIISGASEGGVYKSTDAGKTWNKLSNGLPTGLTGKIDFAVSPADPNVVYANIEASDDQGGLYRSSDRGESWEFVSDNSNLTNRPFYYTNIEANPKDANTVYNNSLRFLRSYDGGKSWKSLSTPHGDNHDIWINPNDTTIWIQSNDGGANVTLNSGESWSTQFNQPTAELYSVEVDDQYPYYLYSGQQDNYSAIAVPSMPPASVQSGSNSYIINVGGCETGPAVPKPGEPHIVYTNCKGRFGVYDKRSGQELQYYVGATNIYGHNPKDLKFRFQRVAPVHVSPHNPNMVYHTSQYVHRTTDDGKTWEIISPDLTAFDPENQMASGSPITRDVTGEEYYSTIYSIRESPIQAGLIWVGANDGPVHVTKDGGETWEDVTPNMPKGGRVDAVEPSPHDPAKAYVAVLRYLLGDEKPYIYKTEDYGQTWTLLTTSENGIPEDFPTLVVREDPKKEGVLYAGTQFGLFISMNDGQSWTAFKSNLPVTPITDIKIHEDDLVMSTMGRGFWILDNLLSLREIPSIGDRKLVFFDTKPAIRNFLYARSETNGPEYPRAGANLNYYLAEKQENLRLEILNEKGEVVHSYIADGPKEPETDTTRNMSTEFTEAPASKGLPNKPGINQFDWNMRHQGGWNKDPKRAYVGNGPLVSTGKYKARLMSGDQVLEQEFDVVLDPRVTLVSDADVAEQEKLSLEIQSFRDDVEKLIVEIEKKKEALELVLEKENSPKNVDVKKQQLESIYYQLVTPDGTYMKPMLQDQARYLGSMLGRSDQKPGQDAYERFNELKSTFDELKKQYDDIK